MSPTKGLAVMTAVLALSACSPESKCRDGVAEMKGQLVGVIGSGEHKEASDPTVQAHTQLDIAQNSMLTGNFEGCVQALDEARSLLKGAKPGK